jgi:elongation factor G
MPTEPGKIRNVAVTGHRGTGKTSLVEAMLFQAGAINRLGTVEGGTTTSDWDEDEQRRQMSLASSICHLEWQGRKINLIDTPGDAGFAGDTVAALRVVEGTLLVASAVMGVEVQTSRVWNRAESLDLPRVVFVNMLDRERADFYRALEHFRNQLSERCVAVHLPIGTEHELTGIVDLLHMTAYGSPEGERESGPMEIPEELNDTVQQYRTQLLDSVVETDEGLMERYLEGEELGTEEVAHALKDAVTRGELFPVACGVATKNLGTTALLDLLVEGVPRREAPSPRSTSTAQARRLRLQTYDRSRAGSTSSASWPHPRFDATVVNNARTRRSASARCSRRRAMTTSRLESAPATSCGREAEETTTATAPDAERRSSRRRSTFPSR